MPLYKSVVCLLTCILISSYYLQAEVSLPNIFGDHMVLQREQDNPVWGKADAGEKVTVTIHDQTHSTVTSQAGTWQVELDPLPTGGPYVMTVAGKNVISFSDVLVGEVWFCSGQSNMQWSVANSYHAELEIASANYPAIRLISVPRVGTQEAQDDFEGSWTACSPNSVRNFSAVGFLFGKRLHSALGVPIGLINNAWGGSAVEAWIPRKTLEADARYEELLDSWDEKVSAYSDEIHASKVKEYDDWRAAGSPDPRKRQPSDFRVGQNRPANIFNGMLNPTVGYGMRGVIWYQGESNAGRAYQYRTLFPLLITTWRELWDQGNFPFYWVQLADFKAEQESPQDSDWAELREAQTMTLALPNTGQAVIIDAGEGRDIHPRDKHTIANRLARHALANEYGFELAAQSPRYTSMQIEDGSILLTFEHLSSGGLYTFDVTEPKGFAISGDDQHFVWAEAQIVGKNQVRVSSPEVQDPVAVRYAWADNPVANVQDRNGLPVTPFRTDDWPGITAGVLK